LRIFSDPTEAELIKCAHNIYNAAKISFWNEMWLIAVRGACFLGFAADIGVDMPVLEAAVGSARAVEPLGL
jgi:UDP-glucose 6-dehydrogenase